MPRLHSCLLGIVGLLCQPGLQAAPLRVGLWQEPSLHARTPTQPETLRRLLAAGERQCVTLSTADLLSPAALDATRLDALVIPYSAYPAAGQAALQRYLGAGGAVFTLAGRPFANLLFPVDGRWVGLDECGPMARELRNVTWDLGHKGERDELKITGDGTAQQPWVFTMADLPGYAYGTLTLQGLGEADAVLVFEACGGPQTPSLCLEANEADRSRWKSILPLTREWREQRVPLAAFCSYATEGRGQAGDYLHPERLASLSVGLFRGLSRGPQEFRLRNLRLCRALVTPAQAAAAGVALPGRELVERMLGETIAPGPKTWWPDLFSGEFVPQAALAKTDDLLPGAPPAGRHDTFLTSLPRVGWADRRLFPGASAPLQYTPLLIAHDGSGAAVGEAAALVACSGGEQAGSVWWSLGTADLDVAANPVLTQLLERGLAYAGSPALWLSEGPRFLPEGEGVKAVCGEHLRGRRAAAVSVRGLLHSPGKTPLQGEAAATAAPGQTADLPWLTAPLTSFDWRAYSVSADLLTGGTVVDSRAWDVDARQALGDLCDYFVKTGATDGKLSGISFIDHRGARTLLAAYELFQDRRYLETALRWGRAMLREQRPDGGYRMGYGITSRGEECYVADGGEIALGIARLVSYAAPAEAAKLRQSLQAYMGYRDSFRVPEGGIGVGWCLQDYGQRPVVPLEKPTRVLAPEINTYTIGCTLGAAWVYAALSGKAEDREAAVADGEWLMPRCQSLSGAFVESYVAAHALAPTPELKQRYADYLQAAFVERMAPQTSVWWLSGGGRSALNLHGLAYCYEHLGRDPRVLAQLARALSAIVARQSPTSIYQLLGRRNPNQEEWIYLCFAGIGIADAVEADVSLRRLGK